MTIDKRRSAGGGITIRAAALSDVPAIVELAGGDDPVWGHDRWTEESRPVYEAAFRRLSATDDHACYVAERSGRVVGFFILTFMPDLLQQGKLSAVLRSVVVLAECRGQGIGAEMVGSAEEIARSRGATTMTLKSVFSRTRAHRFYSQLGYQEVAHGFAKPLDVADDDAVARR